MRELYRRVTAPRQHPAGRIHPIILWLLGVPVPVIILIILLRGCMG